MRLLTLARDLRRRRARERQGLFVAEGVRTVEELLASPLRVRGLLTTSELGDSERGRRLLEEAARRGVERLQVTEADFRSAAETESPQGVLAVGVAPAATLGTLRLPATARVLVLDAVQDPGNVGTILRTAAALGVAATVALPGTVDVWNAKVVRSAMGALFRHPVVPSTTEQLAGWLAEQAVPLWGADARGEPLDGGEIPARLAIAVGNEGAGLTPPVRAAAARLVSLPIASEVESLNVAVAAGILLYVLRS